VLAALPSPAERQQGSWRNSADPKLLEALDSMEKFVTRGIADMDRQGQAEGFQPAWQHVDDLVAVMTPKSLVVDPRTLSGSWNCRRLEVDKSGVLDRGVFRCGIEARSDCLELSKGTGSVRFRGCLHPAGDRHLVFVGRQASFDSEGRRMAEGSEGGFLSQTGTRRVRMILPSRMAGFDVIDLRRP
jgi:hypothetical protein